MLFFFQWHYKLQYLVRPIYKEKILIKRYISEKNNIHDRLSILDFGCGEGIHGDVLCSDQNNYLGVDKNFNYVRLGNSLYPGRHFLICNEFLCVKNSSIDCIVLSNVLHHLAPDEIEWLLIEIKRTLKRDGNIIIIELTDFFNQKGILFRFVTSLEAIIKKVKFRGPSFYINIFQKHFMKIDFKTIDKNFYSLHFKQS